MLLIRFLSQYKLVMNGTAASHEPPCRVLALLQAQPQKLLVSMCAGMPSKVSKATVQETGINPQ